MIFTQFGLSIINAWILKRKERYRQLNSERLSIDSISFSLEREYHFKELKFKVVLFAMNKIRANTVASLQEGFVSKGENCNCWDRIRYKLPCECIIAANPGVLPLAIVDPRWRSKCDESKRFEDAFDGN